MPEITDSINSQIARVDQEIADVEFAEQQAKEQGLGLGQYDLQAAGAARKRDRGKEVRASSEITDPLSVNARQDEDIEEKTIGGMTIRRSKIGEQVAEQQNIERGIRNPSSQNKWVSEARIQKGEGKEGVYIEGEAVEVTPEMIEESPHLQAFKKKHPNFNKVVQVHDTKNKTAWLEPVFDEKEIKASEPKKEDFGSHLDPNLEYQKAMKKYYEGDYTTDRLEAHGIK